MARLIKRNTKETMVLTFAKLIAINKQGQVLLTKNDNGNFELPQTMLNKKQALENTLRHETRIQTGVDVGTISIWEADTRDNHPLHILEIIYTSEDLRNEEYGSFFSLEDLPINMEPASREIVENYDAKMKESFMHFVSAYGHFL